ncbi:conserved Plasmodium protein, unknown function [Plasmodium berghei]|uniref:Uncharacterized protein n=2 Tax=Plasmodium berghei TaxID=5821 RepID=A0A509AJR7_PLABA|nr:conserved protein, unknown function [Plasmodium berghei ANKA]CXH90263.1 conserved Plasmodium protein, unknown function [Plasmodium berghei]SCL90411.1 conserved Plasmodium protein, unknown function [Plasmodium berghei]SCM15292.1 conserved Plasmodium protein, unknown function [Plasmodium berghei]SCM17087.1 conserved Plasmodium protein, unknown function [Plasmodium berghei]SCN22004.1 conserved Plasmodium protein, unknown function [Plasmodium berghei]|eukprot:XP_034419867.1 conserved protein, unknown function [Plasmodium berghei ANKA]
MNNLREKFEKEIKNFKRTALLRGSPAFKISVWLSGFALGFFWILISEYNNPKRNNLFFKKKEPDMFTDDEIQNWNKPYYQKK